MEGAARKLLLTGVLVTAVLWACAPDELQQEKVLAPALQQERMPKKVILLIGDGMGLGAVSAGLNENRVEALKSFPVIGLMRTNPADRLISDSASTATAMATGHKTLNGRVGMDAEGKILRNLVELCEKKGLASGLVSTSSITHATPASFAAHDLARGNYEAIAEDMAGSDADLLIGGGRDHFTKRKDGRNLLEEMEAKGFTLFENLGEADEGPVLPMVCLPAQKHLPSMVNGRGAFLPNATRIALQALDQHEEGFFLMVEGAQIDWEAHDNHMEGVLAELQDFDQAIEVALAFARKDPDTLVIVTGDHETGGLTLIGDEKTKGKPFHFSTDSHSGVLIPVFAYGTGADAFAGIYENTEIFHRIRAKLVLF